MTDSMPLYLRAHTEMTLPKRRWIGHRKQPKYPEYALIFDCETLLDTSQAFILGCYQICHREESGQYICVEEGLVCPDEAGGRERLTIRKYAKTHKADMAKGHSNQIRT